MPISIIKTVLRISLSICQGLCFAYFCFCERSQRELMFALLVGFSKGSWLFHSFQGLQISLLSCPCLTKEINYSASVPHQTSEQFVSTSSPSIPCKHYLYIQQFMELFFSEFDNTGPPSTYQTLIFIFILYNNRSLTRYILCKTILGVLVLMF